MQDIITSDFLWGIIIGLVLTLLGSWALHEKQERIKRKSIARFIEDVIQTINTYVEQINSERQTNNEYINTDYLGLINGEIELYARNREHLINIQSPELRAEIKAFLTEVSIKTARIQNEINSFTRNWAESKNHELGEERTRLENDATVHLDKARTCVDRLLDFMARERITQKLQALSK